MNRQQRRRIQKELLKDLANGNIRQTKAEFERAKLDREAELVLNFLGICSKALRIEFGFGKKRNARFVSKVHELLDEVALGHIDLEDMSDNLK